MLARNPFASYLTAQHTGDVDWVLRLIEIFLVITVKVYPRQLGTTTLLALCTAVGVVWLVLVIRKRPHYSRVRNAFTLALVAAFLWACVWVGYRWLSLLLHAEDGAVDSKLVALRGTMTVAGTNRRLLSQSPGRIGKVL